MISLLFGRMEHHAMQSRGSEEIISKIKGIELLNQMKLVNPRLSVDEIDRLIKRLNKKTEANGIKLRMVENHFNTFMPSKIMIVGDEK
jgi:hypothetical protein